jgi:hypothetical protein
VSRSPASVHVVGLALVALLALTRGSAAAPSYRVDINFDSMFQGVPFTRDASFPVSSSNSTSLYTGHGVASTGRADCTCLVQTDWLNGLSGGGSGETLCGLTTDDFVISGPGGSVTATLHLLVEADLGLQGGFPANDGQSHVWANVSANGIGTYGDYILDGTGTHGSGLFTGYAGSTISVPVNLTGSYPVNSPFAVSLNVQSSSGTYGNISYTPGQANAAGVVTLSDLTGAVMDLPAGYTLNSASWNVANNQWTRPAAVDPRARGGFTLQFAGANPAPGAASLACELPSAGPVHVEVLDLSGRRIRTLADGWHAAGAFRLLWDGRDDSGAAVGSGVYFVRANHGDQHVTLKVARLQ